jgi:hypothetical protein
MRKFLTISLAIAIMAVFQMPLWCAVVDTFAWFLTGHGILGLDWSYAGGARPFFVAAWTGFTFVATCYLCVCVVDGLE